MIDGVRPSGLGAQPIGEVVEVADGIYQLKVPVPIPLGFVSAYLIEGPDGWTLLDTGFDYPDGRAAWEAGATSIGLWPESLPHPLARYLRSLSGMRSMDVNLVLPGHGPIFPDLEGRIGEVLRHHEERLGVMHREIQAGPKTPFEVSGAVFRETLAHLDHLALEGRAERIEDETTLFRAA